MKATQFDRCERCTLPSSVCEKCDGKQPKRKEKPTKRKRTVGQYGYPFITNY